MPLVRHIPHDQRVVEAHRSRSQCSDPLEETRAGFVDRERPDRPRFGLQEQTVQAIVLLLGRIANRTFLGEESAQPRWLNSVVHQDPSLDDAADGWDRSH